MIRRNETEFEDACSVNSISSSNPSQELYDREHLEEANHVLREKDAENSSKIAELTIQVCEMQMPLLRLQIERTSLEKSLLEVQAQLKSETKLNLILRSKFQKLKESSEEQCGQIPAQQEPPERCPEEGTSCETTDEKKKEKKNLWTRFSAKC